MESMATENKNPEQALHYAELAAKCKESSVQVFLNDYGYLYDYVDGNMVDWSVRPNMILAVALDYSLWNRVRRRVCLTFVLVNCSLLRVFARFRLRAWATIRCTQDHKRRGIMPIIKEPSGLGSVVFIWKHV